MYRSDYVRFDPHASSDVDSNPYCTSLSNHLNSTNPPKMSDLTPELNTPLETKHSTRPISRDPTPETADEFLKEAYRIVHRHPKHSSTQLS